MDCEKGERKLTQLEKRAFVDDIKQLIWKISNDGYESYRGPFQFSNAVREELLSAAYLGAAKAANLFSVSFNVKPSTFAYKFIWFEVMGEMTRMSSNSLLPACKTAVGVRPFVFQYDYCDHGDALCNTGDYSCGEHGIEWALAFIGDERDKRIVELRLVNDLTFDEIADIIGVSRGRVCQLFSATIAKISSDVEKIMYREID